MRFIVLFLLALFVAGCQAPKPQPRMAVFNESEYEQYKKPGTSAISGQAFLVTAGGDVKYGAGREVILNPVTTYSTEWYERYVRAGVQLETGDARGLETHHVCTADAEGRFKFSGLPAGSYYILCPIFWFVPGYGNAGGYACDRVDVGVGETREIILNKAGYWR